MTPETEIRCNDPCVVFALGRESGPFLKEFRPHQKISGAPCRALSCGPSWLTVVVIETGIGSAKAQQAMEWLLSRPELEKVPYQPKLVISAGFSGGLQEGLDTGAVVLASEILDLEGKVWPANWPDHLLPDPRLPFLHRGRVLASSRLVPDPEEKLKLGLKYQALAVDMESATVAGICQNRGIPFGCVRAISDDVHTPLPLQLGQIISGDRIYYGRLILSLLKSPRRVGDLWRLARNTRVAAQQLAKTLGALLNSTFPSKK